MPTPAEQLQSAYRLVQQGQFADAQQILLPLVRQSPANADAWWLLATTYPVDPARAQYALEQLLRLRPDDTRARDMLERMRASGVPSRSPFDSSAAPSPVESYPASDSVSRTFGSFSESTSSGYNSAPSPSTDPFGQPSYNGEKRKNDFSSSPPIQQSYTVIPPRRGTHPCVMFLALIGAVTLIGCALCVGLTFSSANAIGPALEQAFGTLGADPDMQRFLESLGTPGAFNFNFDSEGGSLSSNMPADIPNDATTMRVLEYGTSDEYRIGANEYHLFTFSGDAGDRVQIDMEGVGINSSFDSEIALYDPEKNLINQNDDTNELDAQIVMRLPADGTYSILARSHLRSSGTYRLTLDLVGEPTRTPTPGS